MNYSALQQCLQPTYGTKGSNQSMEEGIIAKRCRATPWVKCSKRQGDTKQWLDSSAWRLGFSRTAPNCTTTYTKTTLCLPQMMCDWSFNLCKDVKNLFRAYFPVETVSWFIEHPLEQLNCIIQLSCQLVLLATHRCKSFNLRWLGFTIDGLGWWSWWWLPVCSSYLWWPEWTKPSTRHLFRISQYTPSKTPSLCLKKIAAGSPVWICRTQACAFEENSILSLVISITKEVQIRAIGRQTSETKQLQRTVTTRKESCMRIVPTLARVFCKGVAVK